MRIGMKMDNRKPGEDKLNFYWTFQPDGRYYADEDSFGMEHDIDNKLVSVMNKKGKLIEPFHMV